MRVMPACRSLDRFSFPELLHDAIALSDILFITDVSMLCIGPTTAYTMIGRDDRVSASASRGSIKMLWRDTCC